MLRLWKALETSGVNYLHLGIKYGDPKDLLTTYYRQQASDRTRVSGGEASNSPIAMKISFTFIAVFADVSMNSKLLSSA